MILKHQFDNKISPMICLDFDGVLFDTAKEAYIVANEAYFGKDVEKYAQFLLLRPFVVSAWQYLLIFDLISKNLNNEVLLKNYKQQSMLKPTSRDITFEKKFNSVRERMIHEDKSRWLKLHEPYDFFRLIKPMLIKCPQYFQIVSTKSRKFILELLLDQGIFWNDIQVLDRDNFKECGESKAEVLKRYFNTMPVLFIDDSCKHLNEVELLSNVEVIPANWGYIETSNVEDNTSFAVTKIENYLRDICHSY